MELLVGTLVLRPYVFAFLVVFLVAGARDLGPLRTLGFGAIVWPIAWVAEFASVRIGVPFGLYHYTGLTRGHELYVGGVPFFDSLSFTFLAYASFCLARAALRGRARPFGTMALLAGFVMMMLDVVIDPVAVRGERWFLGHLFYYPEGGVYFGVPLSNFAGWWLVGTVGVGAYEAAARFWKPRRGERVTAGIALYYAVFVFNLAVTAWLGEWRLLAAGVALHALMALALVTMTRRIPSRDVLGTGGVQRA